MPAMVQAGADTSPKEGWHGRGSQELSRTCCREPAFSGGPLCQARQTAGLPAVRRDAPLPRRWGVGGGGDQAALEDRTLTTLD